MCEWAMVPIDPQYPESAEIAGERVSIELPKFDAKFEACMRGKERASGHRGLHTLYGLTEGVDYQIEKNAEGNPDRVQAASCPAVYSASVKLKTRVNYRGKAEWEKDFKLSTFFPDTMCVPHIKEATRSAYLYWKAVIQNASQYPREIAEIQGVAHDPIRWAGKVRLHWANEEFVVWIGSLQAGESERTKLCDSFPTFRGNFIRIEPSSPATFDERSFAVAAR